jgi:hypothetical protein
MATETSAKYNYMRALELRNGRNVEMQPGVPQPTMPDLKDLQPSAAPPTETPKGRASRQGLPAAEPAPAPKTPDTTTDGPG